MQDNTDIQHLSKLQKTLSHNPNASQRELATSTNLSLGMTNALLKRFSDKGWLYMKKISSRNIQYVLTSKGLNELMHRSTGYFKRTAKLMKDYKDIIFDIVKSSNCNTVIIIGNTDLEFLFDFACSSASVLLKKQKNVPTNIENTLVVFCNANDYNEFIQNTNLTDNIICVNTIFQNHIKVEEEMSWQVS